MEIEQILEKVVAELTGAETELERLEDRVSELRNIYQGLVYAQERYGNPAKTAKSPVPDDEDIVVHIGGQPVLIQGVTEKQQWQFMSLKDAVVRVMKELGRPVSTREVYEALQARGRSENYASVRASLNYIKRSSGGTEVASLRAGLWAVPTPATPAPTDAEAPVGAGASDGEGPSDGLSRKEGGTANGAAPPDGRD